MSTHPIGGVTIGQYGLEPCPAFRQQERLTRIYRLQKRGMTFKAAAIVIDAAMFGIGCLEGTVRQRIEEENVAKERDALQRIGNIVGAPTMSYSPEMERDELATRIATVYEIVREALGIPNPAPADPDKTRTNPGLTMWHEGNSIIVQEPEGLR